MALLLAAPLMAAALAGPALAIEAPIVFQRGDDVCYRIPSLARAQSGLVIVAERRHGLADGRKVCNDDGRVDLVVVRSRDGAVWSEPESVIDADVIGAAMADPRSAIHDPDFALVDTNRRWVRVGNQSLAAIGDTLILALEVRYNLSDDCGDRREGCLNSPENVDLGTARARYFAIASHDGGRSWTEPRRIHSEIYGSCVDRLVRDEGLRAALHAIFVDDAVIGPDGVGTRNAVIAATATGRASRDLPAVSAALGVDEAVLRRERVAVDKILNRKLRAGPGNAAAFDVGGATRVYAPAAPLGFYSDDLGSSWTCADTTRIRGGSESQAADLGDGRLVMTLRPIARPGDPDALRLFTVSRDGGASWSEASELAAPGGPTLVDVVSQGSIVALPGTEPPQVVVSNVTGLDYAGDLTDATGEWSRKPTKAEQRRKKRELRSAGPDGRVGLTLSRVVLEGDDLRMGVSGACGPDGRATPAATTIWPHSAAYSVMIPAPETGEILIAFEASDDEGASIARRSWTESIRFARVPLLDIPVATDPPDCRP
jgi:hypothetical protein